LAVSIDYLIDQQEVQYTLWTSQFTQITKKR